MASQSRKHPGKRRERKLTRFSMSRKSEVALAAVGVLVIALVLGFLWLLLSPLWSKPGPAELAARQITLARDATVWREAKESGLLLRVQQDRQELFVNAAKWNAMLPTEHAPRVAAIAGHLGWDWAFIFDASTGRQLGWYVKDKGYHDSPAGAPR
jgi:hypothetical protein